MGRLYDMAVRLRAAMDEAGAMLTDEQAAQVAALYRPWEPTGAYEAGERRTHGGALYRCLQTHEGQSAWTPDAAPSLWAPVLTADSGEPLPWQQPESTNPYAKGDRVTHGGQTWVSQLDGNVWEPGVYGWEATA